MDVRLFADFDEVAVAAQHTAYQTELQALSRTRPTRIAPGATHAVGSISGSVQRASQTEPSSGYGISGAGCGAEVGGKEIAELVFAVMFVPLVAMRLVVTTGLRGWQISGRLVGEIPTSFRI